jgi:hypothetical protein
MVFFKLGDTILVLGLSRCRTWQAFAKPLDAVFCILSTPISPLVTIELLTTLYATKFTMLAGISLGDNT